MAQKRKKKKKALPPIARQEFAQRLRLAREQKYTTAADFAKAVGIEAETYRTYERADREPNITNLILIARKLDASLDFLVLGDIPSWKGPVTGLPAPTHHVPGSRFPNS